MADDYDLDDDDLDGDDGGTGAQGNGGPVRLSREQHRTLKREAKAGREAAEMIAKLTRDNLMLTAGLPADNPMTDYFVKGYSGEMTTEAVKAAAVAAGLIKAAPAAGADSAADTGGDQVTPAGDGSQQTLTPAQQVEAQGHGALAAATATGAGTPAPTQDERRARMEAALTRGGADSLARELELMGEPVIP